MLATLALASMLAAAEAPAPAKAPDSPAPPTETRHMSDMSKLPLQVLHNLPAPTKFDYDGDGQPDPIAFDMAPAGQIVLTVKSSKTGKVQTLYTSKLSLTKLGATHIGMKATGNPTTGASLELWGVKGAQQLSKVSLDLAPASFTVGAEGKKHTYGWSGASFVAK